MSVRAQYLILGSCFPNNVLNFHLAVGRVNVIRHVKLAL